MCCWPRATHGRGLALFLGTWLTPAAALALTFDLSPLGEAGIDYDSNVFRASGAASAGDPGSPQAPDEDEEVSERIHRAGLGLTLEMDHGLQRVIITGVARRLDYQRLDQLDHTATAVDARWSWAVGRAADGIMTYRYERELDDFDNAQSDAPNLQTESRLQFSGGLNITPRFRLGLDLRSFERSNDLAFERRNDLDERTVEGSVSWVSPGRWDTGIGVAHTYGEFVGRNDENAPNLAREYEDLGVNWRYNWFASGVSRFSVRLGHKQRELAPVTGRDFSGFTGRLDYQRRISGKTEISAALYRDVFSVEDVNANFVETDGLELGATWRPTAKTTLVVDARWVDLQFDGQAPNNDSGSGSGAAVLPQRADREQGFGVEWQWDALRWLQVQSGAQWQERTSSEAGTAFDVWLLTFGVQANVD